MDAAELLRYSLGFAFDILDQVTADLTQEQADWKPPGIANTIGSIYSHLITYLDFMVERVCIGQDFSVFAEPPPPEIMMHAVQADLPALHERARKVRAAAQDWVSSLTLAYLDAERDTSIGSLKVGQFLEAYIIWHINVHCGEIAALKGCQGAKGYPW
jgi:hypothetical protein